MTALGDAAKDPGDTDRRRRGLRLAATFLVIFALNLAIVLHEGGATRVDGLDVRASDPVSVVVEKLGSADAGHYVGVGYDIARLRGLPARADRILNWWPPGMHLYFAALFTVFGDTMPVGVVAGITMALLWAIVLTAFVDLLGRHLHWAAVAAMVAILLLSNVMQEWILGFGLLWSEGLFSWCLLVALYAAVRSATAQSDRRRLGWAAATGAILGVSAYVRTVSDLIGFLMVALLVIWGGLTLFRMALHRRRPRAEGAPAPRTWHRELLALALCVAAFQVVTIPWRIFAAQNLRPGDYSWSVEPHSLWHQSWTPDRVFIERGGRYWLLPGRPNTACKVDPVMCRKIADYETHQLLPYSGLGRYDEAEYRRLTIRAFFDYPVEYTLDRVAHLRKAWFWAPVRNEAELVQNSALALALLSGIWLSVRRIRRSGPDLVALLFPGLVLATMAPFAFLQYEARYFVPVRVLTVMTVFVLVALDPAVGKLLRVKRPDPPVAVPASVTVPEAPVPGI